MLEPPDLHETAISACLGAAYGLSIAEIVFLPLGADPDTAVYRAVASDGRVYFLKLRRGHFPEASVSIPYWLAQSGMRQLIAPIAARATGALSAPLAPFTAILYPFISGESGWDVALSPRQWAEFGASLRQLHAAAPPPALLATVPHETYTPAWRQLLAAFLQQAAEQPFADPVAAEFARLLVAQQRTIRQLIARAEQLAGMLRRQPPDLCLCHGDIHAGNLLIDPAGQLYLVDWDTLVLAPKEHDLMYIGAGIGGIWNSDAEAAQFYAGYGPAAISPAALAYYRYERIVQDIAVSCQQLLASAAGGDDRPVVLRQIAGQFAPGNVVAVAIATDQRAFGQADSVS